MGAGASFEPDLPHSSETQKAYQSLKEKSAFELHAMGSVKNIALMQLKKKSLSMSSSPSNISFFNFHKEQNNRSTNRDMLSRISEASEALSYVHHTAEFTRIQMDDPQPSEASKQIRKPHLFVNVNAEAEIDALPSSMPSSVLSRNESSVESDDVHANRVMTKKSVKILMSNDGTLKFGDLRIREDGISRASFKTAVSLRGSFRGGRGTKGPTLSGMEFLEIGSLGHGASGVVVEALHVPTLTIVALKMLPVYNAEKRRQVSRELAVLYKNLVELKAVDESLDLDASHLDLDKVNIHSGSMDSRCGSIDNDLKVGDDADYAHVDARPTSKCPNLLSLYNAYVDAKSGSVNLVIEYMDGGSLEDLVRHGGCQDEAVLSDIARQALAGLLFLHAQKCVHRDVKPANILVSSNGVVKIADFGISRAMDGTMAFANTFVGTVCYMSPERIAGSAYTFSSDIWSLGLTLLAVTMGEFPLNKPPNRSGEAASGKDDRQEQDQNDVFTAVTEHNEKSSPLHAQWQGEGGYWGMLKAICDQPAPLPGPSFSHAFNNFIGSCLRKTASDRPSAASLLEDTFVLAHISSRALAGALGHGPSYSGLDAEIRVGVGSRGEVNVSASAPGLLSPQTIESTVPSADPRQAAASVSRQSSAGGSRRSSHGALTLTNTQTLDASDDMSILQAIRLEHLERVIDKLLFYLYARFLQKKTGGGQSDESDPLSQQDFALARPESFTTYSSEQLSVIDDTSIDQMFETASMGEPPSDAPNAMVAPLSSYSPSGSNPGPAWLSSERNNSSDVQNPFVNIFEQNWVDEIRDSLTNAESTRNWRNLSCQLHLPFNVVKYVVESKLLEGLAAIDVESKDAVS